MNYEELVKNVLLHVGGRENVTSVTNCMTRLRIKVKDDQAIDTAALKSVSGVLGTVHDRANYVEVVVGPGKSSKCGAVCRQMGIPASGPQDLSKEQDWKKNKEAFKAGQKDSSVRSALKIFGEIFVPLIPGVIASGLCAGLNILIQQTNPGWEDSRFLSVVCTLLSLIHTSFLTYLTAWTGYRAAERFGGTPILGGMLGMITGLDGINTLAGAVGWWNEASPLDSTLRSGRGGILAVVFGVMILVRVEKWIRSHIPEALDVVFTPLFTLLACVIPYVFVIMPLLGLVSGGICFALPMVSMGMHHGLVALYSVQLQQLGYITLYPALCMAGAGQVGAALAIFRKAKKVNNERLRQVINGALPAGILGVGEPLIYGVTLPMGRPFITAGIGAGFGGAFVMAMQVAATTWGPSGILGVFTMTAGPNAGLPGVMYYLAGLLISCVMAFLITTAFVSEKDVLSA